MAGPDNSLIGLVPYNGESFHDCSGKTGVVALDILATAVLGAFLKVLVLYGVVESGRKRGADTLDTRHR